MRPTWLLVSASLLLAGCGGGGGANYPSGPSGQTPTTPTPTVPVASASVSMNSVGDGYGGSVNSFSPTSILLTRNGTVTWSNGSGVMHTVNFESGAAPPADIAGFISGTAVRTFPTAGIYMYRCTLHDGMTGSITVQ